MGVRLLVRFGVFQWRLLASRAIIAVLAVGWLVLLGLGAAWDHDFLATAPLLLTFLAVGAFAGVWGGPDEQALRTWLAGSAVSARAALLASVVGRAVPLILAVVVQAVVIAAVRAQGAGVSVGELAAGGGAVLVQTAGMCTVLSLFLPGAFNAVAFLIVAASAFQGLSAFLAGADGLTKVALSIMNPLLWSVPQRTAQSVWGPLLTGLVLVALAVLAAPARAVLRTASLPGAVLAVESAANSFRRFLRRRQRVLRGVGFTVPRGRIVGLLGRNGAGKTTTLRAILGELALDEGGVTWQHGCRAAARFLPETDPLAAGLRPRHYLPLVATGAESERVHRLAELLHVGECLGARAGALSFGQRRRAALLVTVAAPAPVYLLDEPATGIDPLELEAMKGLLRQLRGEGAAVILSTHLLREFEDVIDEVVLLDGGRVIAAGPVAELEARLAAVALDRNAELPGLLPEGSVVSGARIIVAEGQRAALVAALTEAGVAFQEVPPTLHDVFSWTVQSTAVRVEEGSRA